MDSGSIVTGLLDKGGVGSHKQVLPSLASNTSLQIGVGHVGASSEPILIIDDF
jgi:hypothetical protein